MAGRYVQQAPQTLQQLFNSGQSVSTILNLVGNAIKGTPVNQYSTLSTFAPDVISWYNSIPNPDTYAANAAKANESTTSTAAQLPATPATSTGSSTGSTTSGTSGATGTTTPNSNANIYNPQTGATGYQVPGAALPAGWIAGTPPAKASTPTVTGGAGTTGTVGSVGISSPSSINTGNPNLDSLYSELYGMVTKNLAAGSIINPALNITPDTVSQFINEAKTSLSPNGQQAINQEIDGINASLKNLSTQYQNSQGTEIANFGQNLFNFRNNAADTGTAFSGQRNVGEQNLVGNENRTLSNLDSSYATNVGNALRTGAAAVGNSNGNLGLTGGLNSFNQPTIQSYQVSATGGDRGQTVGNGGVDLGYNPSNYTYGNLVYGDGGYASKVANSAANNISNYLTGAANNSKPSFSGLT